MGLQGEVEDTLAYLKSQRNDRWSLGLREVMDAPHLLDAEWKRNDVMRKIGRFYDSVWVYGPPDFYDPLVGLDVPPAVRSKMDFVGFLQSNVLAGWTRPEHKPKGDYILITTGGGGDGSDLIHDVRRCLPGKTPTLTHNVADRARPLYAGQASAPSCCMKCCEDPLSRGDRIRQPHGRADRWRQGRARHGRLQHLLRDPVLRQAGARSSRGSCRAKSSLSAPAAPQSLG